MPHNTSTLILIALMVVAFYFLIMRPQRKRQQAMQKTMNELRPAPGCCSAAASSAPSSPVGDEAGRARDSPGVELTVLKQAIARVVTDADEDTLATRTTTTTTDDLEPRTPSRHRGRAGLRRASSSPAEPTDDA